MRALRALRALGWVALGVVVGAASVLVHGRTTGMVLAVVATVATAWALPGGWGTRFAFSVGWVGVLGLALAPRSGGGYLVSADTRGYTLLALGLVLLLWGIVTVRPMRSEPPQPL